MAFEITITNAGRAALVNGANTGTLPVVIAAIGLSSSGVAPSPAAVSLPGEFKRVPTIAGEVVADDTIHVTLRDDSADAYELRSLGLYLENGTLFALYGQSTPILEKTAGSIALVAIDVIFADIAAAAISFGSTDFTNPPATTERLGVVELATTAEAQTGDDTTRAITPATGKASAPQWLFRRPVHFTTVIAETPGDESSGAIRLAGNAGTQRAHLQVLSPDLAAQWGFWRFTPTGEAGWNGAAGLRNNGHVVWHAGNDGAASGLDADLLDGEQGSFYTNIPARLGYTPVNRAGDTITGVLRLISTVIFGAPAIGPSITIISPNRLSLFNDDSVNERFSLSANGYLNVAGARDIGSNADIQGSGNLRVFARTPGGQAISTYDTQNYTAVQFVRDLAGSPTQVGSITCSETATAYNTSSDYRLKEDLRPVEDPIERLKRLRPVNFAWKGSDVRADGFIAHELAEVIPGAVTGQKDGMREIEEVISPATLPGEDARGRPRKGKPAKVRKRLVPDYQGIDQAKIVPLLTAALIEAVERIEALEARLATQGDSE